LLTRRLRFLCEDRRDAVDASHPQLCTAARIPLERKPGLRTRDEHRIREWEKPLRQPTDGRLVHQLAIRDKHPPIAVVFAFVRRQSRGGNLARTAAAAKGFGALRVHVLPHPMESRPEIEVRAIARARFRDILRLLADDV